MRRRYASVGGRLDLRIRMLHWDEMVRPAGYGAGLQDSGRSGHECMLSLRILWP